MVTKRIFAAMVMTTALSLLSASAALGVLFGTPDGDDHPYVGLLVVYYDRGECAGRCSGSLLAPTVFVTAAHCIVDDVTGQVWFESVVAVSDSPPGYPFDGGITADSLHVFPDYQAPTTLSYRDAAHAHDLGVVILDEPVWMDRYGELPTLGLLEDLAAVKGKTKANLTVVGYGLQQVKPVEIDGGDQRIRTVGSVSLVNLASTLSDGFNVQVTGNPGRANGGAGICFGDSGGPLLVGDTDIALGVHALVI